ncbi:MAG: hypothetical protein RBU23_12005 [Candidatus Auribacterota bacterium]|jgi:hypothetical protein|nr:hypothetical protein [Candidatus Auribacterota bacterium]
MNGIIQWIDIARIHVTDRVRQNYSHLSDVMAVLREKRELEIPVLVAGKNCIGRQCEYHCRKDESSSVCSNGNYTAGMCLKTPLLIDGATRLEAARRLKWPKINCFVVEPKHESWIREVEIITNTMRKPFDLWEKVKAGLILERMESRKAQERLKAGKPIPESRRGRVRDLVAKKAGFTSANSFLSAKQVYTHGQTAIKNLVEKGIFKVTPAARIALLPAQTQQFVAQIGDYVEKHSFKCSRLIGFLARTAGAEHTEVLGSIAGALSENPAFNKKEFERFVRDSFSKAKTRNVRYEPEPVTADSGTTGAENIVEVIGRHIDILVDCVMNRPQLSRLDEQTVTELDKLLLRSEKISRNLREQMRIEHPFFADSHADQVRRYYSMFIECMQFFSHTLVIKKQFTHDALMEELYRAFHNCVTILHKAAGSIARQLR